MQIYQQPKRRQIYKPLTKICPATVVDGWGRSTYRQSYKHPGPQPKSCRPTVAPTEDLWPRQDNCREEFNWLTVHRASFLKWSDADRTLPAVQNDHELVGGTQEHMQTLTSHRNDFVGKCLPEAERQRATGPAETIGTNCGSGACAMTGITTTADTFGSPCTIGRRPLARPSTAAWSQGPNILMDKETETSSSYQQWGPLALPRPRPLAAYCRSGEPVNGRTVYKVSYRPPGSFRDPLPGEQLPANGYGNDHKSTDEAEKNRPFYPRAHDYNLYRGQ
ncbi:hypothetical protein QTP88_003941 [Uroleucon formosanum]